jgi:hypothetical protein
MEKQQLMPNNEEVPEASYCMACRLPGMEEPKVRLESQGPCGPKEAQQQQLADASNNRVCGGQSGGMPGI